MLMSRMHPPILHHLHSQQISIFMFMLLCSCVKFSSVQQRAGSVWQHHPPFYGTWQARRMTDNWDTKYFWIMQAFSAMLEMRWRWWWWSDGTCTESPTRALTPARRAHTKGDARSSRLVNALCLQWKKREVVLIMRLFKIRENMRSLMLSELTVPLLTNLFFLFFLSILI